MDLRNVLLCGSRRYRILLQPSAPELRAQQPQSVAIDADDIGGVVTGPNGPEAGVWVIAETTDLPTRYTKSVVTDDQGRYVIPDLPVANYQVFVRGYGLVDSPRMRAKPGQVLNHAAVPAPNERAAAHYYPAIYWYTMMKIPPAKDFGGSTDIPKNITQDHLAPAHGQCRLRRLSPARPGSDAHDPRAVRKFRDRRGSLDAPHRRRPVGRVDDQPHRRSTRRRALQVFRRLDRSRRARRTSEAQAAASAGRRAQCRRDHLGLVAAEQVSARPDLVGPPQAHGQCQRQALRRAGIFDRHDADPRSEDAYGELRSSCRLPIPTCRSRSDRAMPERSSRRHRRPIGATRCCGIRAPTITIPCSTTKAGSGLRPACAD